MNVLGNSKVFDWNQEDTKFKWSQCTEKRRIWVKHLKFILKIKKRIESLDSNVFSPLVSRE